MIRWSAKIVILIVACLTMQCKSDGSGDLIQDSAAIEAAEMICSSLIPGEVLLLPPHEYVLDKMNRSEHTEITYASWAVDIRDYANCKDLEYVVYDASDPEGSCGQATHTVLIDAVSGPMVLTIGSIKQKEFVIKAFAPYADRPLLSRQAVHEYLAKVQ